ncbi:hypothetical protein FRC10_009790 [Ceratobasidium sp. 414]|nr:hypothetical protein FRC10_009790 [Ceratobasidium sp. 414]
MNTATSPPRQAEYIPIDEHLRSQPLQPTARPLRSASPTNTMVPHLTKGPEHNAKHARHPVPKRRMKLLLTYSLDCGLFYLLDSIEGFKRQFSLADTSIQYPFAEHERVPPFALYMIALVAPAVLMLIVNLLTVRSWWDWHNILLGLATTGSLTQVVKVTVGRPRPDLIDRCQPISGAAGSSLYGLVSANICTQTDHAKLKDGFRSFFSGHSSLSFAGLGFLSFYLAGKMHLFDKRGHTSKAWVSLIPLTGALLVAISQDQAGIPSSDDEIVQNEHIPGTTPLGGESIELSGTVKRGGEDLSEMWRKDRDERHMGNQRAAAQGDAAHNV